MESFTTSQKAKAPAIELQTANKWMTYVTAHSQHTQVLVAYNDIICPAEN